MKKLNLGLFGFGVVGEGIYQVLSQKPHLGCRIRKIAIKHPEKERNAPGALFTTDAEEILNDPGIDLVVELIDNADDAFTIVTKAMNKGKSVVSANKKMIAEHHLELIAQSTRNRVSFLYEAAVCGSVPIIRNLEEYFDNDLLTHVQGIVNGSTNYILSKMKDEKKSYPKALEAARKNGFAESDPTLDVEGTDAAYKISIITLHAFGRHIHAQHILRKGITSLKEGDFRYAREKGLVIKLIAQSTVNDKGEPGTISVLPTFIEKDHAFSRTNDEFNGLLIGSSLADEQFFYGKGAGRYPTSSAVLSDISAFRYGYRYAYRKGLRSAGMPARQSSKFYVGFDRNPDFDPAIFDSVEEHYTGKDREYFIGVIPHERLRESGLLHKDNVSLIAFH